MRLTSRGRFTATLAGGLWVVSLATGSPYATVGALALSAAFAHALATLERPRVKADRQTSRMRLQEGGRIEEQLTVTLQSRRRTRVRLVESADDGLVPSGPSSFDVLLRHDRPLAFTIDWTATVWGRRRLGPLRVVARDPLGLIESAQTTVGALDLLVHPAIEGLGKFQPRASNPEPALGAHNVTKPGDAMEFFALREYVPGDSVRRINWRATARSGGRMIVNQMTRDSFSRVLIVVDLRAKELIGGPTRCSRTANGRAVAALLAHHERSKDHVTLLAISNSGMKLSLAPNPRLNQLMDALAEAADGGRAGLHGALREHMTSIRPRSPVYLITSASLDAELEDALRLVMALGGRPHVVSPVIEPTGRADVDEVRIASRTDALARARAVGANVYEWRKGETLEGVLRAV